MPGVSELQVDFVKACLELDPLKRKSAGQLLNHPIFAGLRSPVNEIKATDKIKVQVDLLKGKDYPLESIKSFIVKLVLKTQA